MTFESFLNCNCIRLDLQALRYCSNELAELSLFHGAHMSRKLEKASLCGSKTKNLFFFGVFESEVLGLNKESKLF